MKRLILMRHAKTEPWNEGIKDRDRMLTERGHQDAELVASFLSDTGWQPDHALVSSARRTRETWRHLARHVPECRSTVSDDLYLAGIPAMEALIKKVAEDYGCVILVGHNPGLHELAGFILSQAGSENHRAAMKLAEKFPTGAAALFESEDDGPYVPVHFRLVDFVRPKTLA
ncbi:SixA phosphatase family protein [Henriciella pelagia]|jgi:phosphohistidine phosphatase|uniref:Phosphoglycerate mutase n=1 Tax=Henriciella pelagia TaxID=1977912 RepID=A0ABQ1JVI0_9PROT|nr:histidine phosphatase family protein [Henriciella pelagia]GGB78380.1 phosphoglycerate mutase [Henriciella pelagia]